MSVNSAMTAIADKIRALLGISGTMGLDAMATNLTTVQTNVTNAFTAVGNKGGTVPSSKTSGNLASAINGIPIGVTVQRKTGTFTSRGNNAVSVNCGLAPDMVIFYAPEANEDGSYYNMAFPFGETGESSHNSQSELSNGILYCQATKSQNGFVVNYCNFYSFDWEAQANKTYKISYLAIKYT